MAKATVLQVELGANSMKHIGKVISVLLPEIIGEVDVNLLVK
jgi:uncharacterized protein YqeY